jgi:predicted TIM-barrel fold metal-dependent hydrolase
MDEHIEWRGAVEAPELSRLPSEYFKSNCYVSIECDELPGVQAIEALDGECVVFSTDYPHGDSKYPHATEALMKLPMSEAHRRKVLWDNCARLYKLTD